MALQWLWPPPWALAIPLWLATATLAFVGAVSTHNVMHSPMFSRRWMNCAWRGVQTLWYGQPVSVFVPVHNQSHHRHVQSRRDLTRTTRVDLGWQLANLVVGTQWQLAAKRGLDAWFATRPRSRIRRHLRQEGLLLIAFYGVLLALDWRSTLVFVWAPHLVASAGIRAVNYLQHDGCAYDASGFDHSRNFVGRPLNWLFLNNGFHTVHHLRPGVHWSQLPALHAELVAPHIHPALEVQSFGPWFWHHMVWPGLRIRYDGQPYEGQPSGEGPDLPWDPMVWRSEVVPCADRRRSG
ncbi:MAG: fatty acid desaturase [Myxococcota bacterium]